MSMVLQNVTVFGASGRQGLAQVRRLLAEGYRVRAVTRGDAFHGPQWFGVQTRSADYKDPASLEKACEGADAVFYTSVAFSEQSKGLRFAKAVGAAAEAAGVKRLIFNTSSWVPNSPVGQSGYDGRLSMENALEAAGVPLVVFRPVLFMDNLLTGWARPFIVRDGTFVYAHRPDLQADWICLDDVAAFMTHALTREDLIGERIVIGGPERLTPTIMAETLSGVLGRPIRYEAITPRAFGALLYTLFENKTDVPRDAYIAYLDEFYQFNNSSQIEPFKADMTAVKAKIDLPLTPFKEWAARQDWVMPDLSTGPSGG
jgi:uncharacterized protein YbjT (DUF2867 family)